MIFQALRKTMYLRRVKLDKLRELIQNPQPRTPARKAPDVPPAAANYTPPLAMPYGSGPAPTNNWAQNQPANLPYPLRPTSVGMPTMPTANYR